MLRDHAPRSVCAHDRQTACPVGHERLPLRTPRDAPVNPWLTTAEMCARLRICRSTLMRIKSEDRLLRSGRHWTRKNPASDAGPLLWHVDRVCAALKR
jgi:hypothetical protein